MRMLRCWVAIGAIALSSGTGSAQLQSLESAKALLKKSLPGLRANKNDVALDAAARDGFREIDDFTGTLGAGSDVDACWTRFAYTRGPVHYQAHPDAATAMNYDLPPDATPFELIFRRLSDVKLDGVRVDFAEQGRSRRRAVFFADPKAARRAAAALNVAREACLRQNDAG